MPTLEMRNTSRTSARALEDFFERRLEQAGHGLLDLVRQVVNDRVQADVDLFLFGERCGRYAPAER